MLLQGVVFDPSGTASADGLTNALTMGRANDLILSTVHGGKYFEQCYRGNIYYASTATGGVVVPITSSTAPTFTIWNPAGSGKLCVPIVTLIGWTATTAALGSLVWSVTTNTGSSFTTAAPLQAFGTGTPVNAFTGAGKNSGIRIATGGTTTLAAAAIVFRETGLQLALTTAATSTQPGWIWRDEWEGMSLIPPGNAIHLLGTTAIAITACVTLVYEEIPL